LTYLGETGDMLNYLEKLDGIKRAKIALDMFGFYWHVNPMTLVGLF